MFLVFAAATSIASGQISKAERRWIRVGALHHFVEAYGQERAWNGTYYQGMIWPAEYNYKDHHVSKRFWFAVTDFTDVHGTFWNYKSNGFLAGDDFTRTTAMKLHQTARFAPTVVTVDGKTITALAAQDVDEIDPTIRPDRIVVNQLRTEIGVTMTRRIHAFSQQYHNNYFIISYTFKNTGNIDSDDEIELPNQNLTDLMVGGMFHMVTNREAAIVLRRQNGWGYNQWHTKRGENYADWLAGDLTADSLRADITWMGLDAAFNNPAEHIGGPHMGDKGRLVAADYAGTLFLHTDKSATDKSDDPYQPRTLGWLGNGDYPDMSLYAESESKIAHDMLNGIIVAFGDTTRMDDALTAGNPYPKSLTGAGGAAGLHGYGPFDLAFGDSITYIEAVGVAGISRAVTREVGEIWYNAGSSFTLPDGSTTNNRHEYKDAWVHTSFDSLLQTFGRARAAYNAGMDIPQPPEPPATFTIESGGDRISLLWTANPGVEEASDFGGYRIYRAQGRSDTVHALIYECGLGTENPAIVHQFDDLSAVRGFPYYYYITAFNDGSNNSWGGNPPGQLESSRYYTQTTDGAFLRRQAGSSLKAIRVVPNPFHIKGRGRAYSGGPDLQYGADQTKDRIMFLNIPGQCTIRIFTERGDLIKTIRHTNGSGDEPWNSDTDYRQVVVSGIYLVEFTVDADQFHPVTGELVYFKGDKAVRKMIIVR